MLGPTKIQDQGAFRGRSWPFHEDRLISTSIIAPFEFSRTVDFARLFVEGDNERDNTAARIPGS
jgi:hypothetical protein